MAQQPNHLIERAAALLHAGKASWTGDAPAEPAGQAAVGNAAAQPLLAPLLPNLNPAPVVFSPAVPAAVPPSFQQAPLGQAGPALPLSATETRNPSAPAPLLASLVPLPTVPYPASPRPPAKTEFHPLPSLPVITLDTMEAAGMVVARTARTRISEEYRIVVGRVLRALHDDPDGAGPHNVVMVTSARPGEGKSFTALNLAGSIAQHSMDKVLLVDLDAKLCPISALLGVGDRLGFHDLVVDPTLRPEDVVLNTAVSNLTFLPVGTRLGEDTGVARVRPITPTIARLAQRFPKHLIMLDAPPCLSTSDPHTVAPFVGQVVMVVEAERTQRSEVEAALDLVRVCPTVTMLLNKVKLTTSHTFGAYDYYGSYS